MIEYTFDVDGHTIVVDKEPTPKEEMEEE